jgi:hypothetical protein
MHECIWLLKMNSTILRSRCMPNVVLGTEYGEWAGNIFALQLLPVDDKNTIELAMDFMKQAWRVFG